MAERLLDEAMGRFPLSTRPKIVWKKLRVTAGQAFYRTGTIGLSSILLDAPDKLRTTLLHEYAHLLAYQRKGKAAANHGEAWRQAMRDLGLEPNVRHQYQCERNTPRQAVVYRCRRCGQEFARSRRLPRNRKYVHAGCGGPLTLVGVRPATDSQPHA